MVAKWLNKELLNNEASVSKGRLTSMPALFNAEALGSLETAVVVVEVVAVDFAAVTADESVLSSDDGIMEALMEDITKYSLLASIKRLTDMRVVIKQPGNQGVRLATEDVTTS